MPVWGIALGGGAARGWVHIGVLQAITEAGFAPQVVCGTSIGALVGAAYAAGNLETLADWVVTLTKIDVIRFFELDLSWRGVVDTDRLRRFLVEHVASEDLRIEDLPMSFAAVATDMDTGQEVWLKKGKVLDAVWASIALPGLLPAIRHRGRWLLDGGLVNPVPVSVCRALGAEVVLAVNLNTDLIGRQARRKERLSRPGGWRSWMTQYAPSVFSSRTQESPPSLFEAVAAGMHIILDRITRSRMAGDPPDLLLAPRLSHLGLMEFHRAEEAMAEGRRIAQGMMEELRRLLDESDKDD